MVHDVTKPETMPTYPRRAPGDSTSQASLSRDQGPCEPHFPSVLSPGPARCTCPLRSLRRHGCGLRTQLTPALPAQTPVRPRLENAGPSLEVHPESVKALLLVTFHLRLYNFHSLVQRVGAARGRLGRTQATRPSGRSARGERARPRVHPSRPRAADPRSALVRCWAASQATRIEVYRKMLSGRKKGGKGKRDQSKTRERLLPFSHK